MRPASRARSRPVAWAAGSRRIGPKPRASRWARNNLNLGALLFTGYLLGWSIAWPPGPINAEIVRRGLGAGFRAGFAVALGASTGDALWALGVGLGAGFFLATPAARLALGIVSTVLLLMLAAFFLRGAARAFQSRHVAAASGAAGRGYPLGLAMALTSPWNIAFWLAVLGRPETAQLGIAGAIVVAAAVIAGTLSWCVLLCSSVALLRLRFDGAWWQAAAMGATGLLMLAFAILNIARLAGF